QSAYQAAVDIGQSQNMQSQPDNANAQSITLRRSTRPRSQPDRYLGVVLTEDQDILVVDGDEPETYKQAMTSPDSAKWQEAMKSEMDSMFENQAWDLVNLPVGYTPIGCK